LEQTLIISKYLLRAPNHFGLMPFGIHFYN